MADVSSEVTQRELFGGAMRISLPSRFMDVSDVRPVPDHQEVFADVDTDSSVIVEVLELHEAENVAQYYFHDMAEANGAEDGGTVEDEAVMDSADVSPTNVQSEFYSVRGLQQVAKFREAVANSVLLLMGVIRLPNQQSDVLVTVNRPLAIDEASSSHKSAGSVDGETARQEAEALFRQALTSLRIEDLGLFGE